MCELLEVCVPICICMFRSCQFGLMGLMCIIQCFGECCRGCCPQCCECHEKQKAVSQEDVRVDTVDGAWGENKNKNKNQSKPLVNQPSRGIPTSAPQHNMDSGWDDAPHNVEQSRMDEGWDNTPLNLDQPCIEGEPTNSPSTNPVVSNEPVPSAPVAPVPLHTMETSTTISSSVSTNIPPPEHMANYTSSDFIHPTAPPSYDESVKQDGGNRVA